MSSALNLLPASRFKGLNYALHVVFFVDTQHKDKDNSVAVSPSDVYDYHRGKGVDGTRIERSFNLSKC